MCIMYWKIGENLVLVKIHKNTFFVLYLLISPKKNLFFFGEKNLVALDTHAGKNEPLLDRSGGGGGVPGKVCWFIA